MSDHKPKLLISQPELLEDEAERSLLDQLLINSRLYRRSRDYKELLDFVARLRNFAPFNAMLLQLQKPGLSYAASARDWRERFGRRPKEGARPLLILWPFAPVALVYDVMDTEGKPLPADVQSFFARGPIDDSKMKSLLSILGRKHIESCWVDAGDGNAGLIKVVLRPEAEKKPTIYRIHLNRNHAPPVQFVTLAHELGHLFLGHLGRDRKLKIPQRLNLSHAQRELEAESVAYIVCERNGVKVKSQTYLYAFVNENTTIDQIDVYRVMHAAGEVERILDLATPTRFDRPQAEALPDRG